MNIYVGNLAYQLRDEEINEIFSEYGKVDSINIINDRYSGKSKGFGFVEMPNDAEAEKAIEALDGKVVKGRNMRVNKAKPKGDRPQRRNQRFAAH